jgi:hypothetical protein
VTVWHTNRNLIKAKSRVVLMTSGLRNGRRASFYEKDTLWLDLTLEEDSLPIINPQKILGPVECYLNGHKLIREKDFRIEFEN